MSSEFFQLERISDVRVLRLSSSDGTNRLTRSCVLALTNAVDELGQEPEPLIITGTPHFFSAGADLAEIAALNGPRAYEFSKMGQRLMNSVANFPAPLFAAISGYCMGGGLDLALACHRRVAAPNAVLAIVGQH